jgi:hypothetical protein
MIRKLIGSIACQIPNSIKSSSKLLQIKYIASNQTCITNKLFTNNIAYSLSNSTGGHSQKIR